MSHKEKVIKGVFWSGIESYGQYFVQFIVSVIIARILTPSEFGIIELLTVFTSFGQILVDGGFGQALIRKQDVTMSDYSTVFFLNIGMGIFLYTVLFFIAPYIASFYDLPLLTQISRVVFVVILINSFAVVQNVLLVKKFEFRKLAIRSLFASIFSGIIGICLAKIGCGVWALVTQIVCFSIINIFILFLFTKWKPTMDFSFSKLKSISGYSSKLLFVGVIDVFFSNLQSLFIGKFYSKADLGFYSQARKFQAIPTQISTSVIQKVTFPALSEFREDDERVLNGYRNIMKMACFIVFPIMFWMLAVSDNLFVFILTEKWSMASEYFKPLSIVGILFPLYSINSNILRLKGKYILTVNIAQKTIVFILLLLTIWHGILAVAWGFALATFINTLISMTANMKLINYKIMTQFKDVIPYFVISIVMSSMVYFLAFLFDNLGICIFIQLILGISFYLLANQHLKTAAFVEFKSIVCKLILKSNK